MRSRAASSFPLVGKVEQALRRSGLVVDGLIVAVSGGADSVTLLRALLLAGHTRLVIAHLNHQLRGSESDSDEAFVRQLHARLTAGGNTDLQLRCERRDVAALAEAERANLEQVARCVRYEWLASIAVETGFSAVVTGHTADDQAETVLHRLLRGTGLRGLRGIALRRPLAHGVQVIRPLLTATRAEVLAFLDQLGQDACQDSTNFDCDFTRNRIRHELLPLLAQEYNPAVARVLGNLAEEAHEAYDLEKEQALAILKEAERPRAANLLVFDRGILAGAARNTVRALFRLIWEREGWPADAMNFDAWDRLANVARGAMTAVDLPGGLHARAQERVVQVGPRP